MEVSVIKWDQDLCAHANQVLQDLNVKLVIHAPRIQ